MTIVGTGYDVTCARCVVVLVVVTVLVAVVGVVVDVLSSCASTLCLAGGLFADGRGSSSLIQPAE